MKITYGNAKVEKYLSDPQKLKKKVDPSWVRIIVKQINALKASENFGDFLAYGMWHPEPLSEPDGGCWSIRISGNVRMILKLSADGESVMLCPEIEVKGVCDYHGSKTNWYIP